MVILEQIDILDMSMLIFIIFAVIVMRMNFDIQNGLKVMLPMKIGTLQSMNGLKKKKTIMKKMKIMMKMNKETSMYLTTPEELIQKYLECLMKKSIPMN